MSKDLQLLRDRLGSKACVTVLPDEVYVPWRPLTVSELLEIERTKVQNLYPIAYVENEIFKMCVLDEYFIKNILFLPAGDISTVANSILAYSKPANVYELNQVFELSRQVTANIVHTLASHICVAFPAYKLEDIYAMDYQTMILRAAQAEAHLLRTGYMVVPFDFVDNNLVDNESVESAPPPSPQDLARQYQAQQTPQPRRRHPPPGPGAAPTQEIISKSDMMESNAALLGHEKDPFVIEQQTQETAQLYDNYMNQMARGEKVKIKTDEERAESYQEHIDKIKAETAVHQAKQKILDKIEWERCLKVQEDARRKKDNRLKRRRR